MRGGLSLSPLRDQDHRCNYENDDDHGEADEVQGQVSGRGPDGTCPGGVETSSLRSSAILLVVDWPSDWFPVIVMVKVPEPEYW